MEDSMRVRKKMSSRGRAAWFATFVLVFLVALAWPLFNRATPALFGIPFFLWFQFAWIIVSAFVTAFAYKAGA